MTASMKLMTWTIDGEPDSDETGEQDSEIVSENGDNAAMLTQRKHFYQAFPVQLCAPLSPSIIWLGK